MRRSAFERPIFQGGSDHVGGRMIELATGFDGLLQRFENRFRQGHLLDLFIEDSAAVNRGRTVAVLAGGAERFVSTTRLTRSGVRLGGTRPRSRGDGESPRALRGRGRFVRPLSA